MHDSSNAAWEKALLDVHKQAAGLLQLHMVPDIDELTARGNVRHFAAGLALAEMLGDPFTISMLRALADTARRYRLRAKRRDPLLCLCCPRPIINLRGCTGVIAVPDVDTPRNCIGSVLCGICAAAPGRREKLQTAFRGVWPEGRIIDTPRHKPGHA